MSSSDYFEKFIREVEIKKTVPYKCPKCCSEPENYYGRLIFSEEELPAYCPNHKAKIRLVPAK